MSLDAPPQPSEAHDYRIQQHSVPFIIRYLYPVTPPISHGSQNVFSLRLIRLRIFGVRARVFNRSIATGPLLRCILDNRVHATTTPSTGHSE